MTRDAGHVTFQGLKECHFIDMRNAINTVDDLHLMI